ncbi:hypothetical protein V9K67_16190 [Paraflavisolibacter sp. H34]|uniref:hypothetical protein n=1 Tax=Huijunlia imazamoxiresistens TaxID=3127457 RepID=UPI00301AF19F
MKKLRIIVSGFIGLYPTGGVTWDYIQYPLGLHLMGHDVYYLEDTQQYARYQSAGRAWDDASDSIEYLKKTMEEFGLTDRWAYRDIGSGRCYGMSLEQLKEICRTADVFINVSAATVLREEYLHIPTRALIDSDPMFTQVEYRNEHAAGPGTEPAPKASLLEWYTHHFSFGEHMHREGCLIPTLGVHWKPTRQPICLGYWANEHPMPNHRFTSVMNWSVRSPLQYNGQQWGQKDVEFEKVQPLPQHFPAENFHLLLTGVSKEQQAELNRWGWTLSDPLKVLTSPQAYKSFITHSTAEFSVAKETYVKANSGWFSCRSACYLAAGRPVITQETQWSRYIPSGRGLFAFTDLPSAVGAIAEVAAAPRKHSDFAREIARDYFDSSKVLNDLLNRL